MGDDPVEIGIESALLDVFRDGHRLDKAIERRLRESRAWTPEQRERLVVTLHTLTREWRLRWQRAGLPPAGFLNGVTPERVRAVMAAPVRPDTEERTWSVAVQASLPDWLESRGRAELQQDWPSVQVELNQPAPLFVRVNTLRTTAAELIAALAEEGCEAVAVPGHDTALCLRTRADLFQTQPFRDGWFEVQDLHSQAVARCLDVQPGQRVIDACAGAGGKSLHLAAVMKNKGRIIALDTVEWKLAELRRRAARAGVDNLEARLALDPKVRKRLLGTADRVLIDVPCSGLGVLRRNPDARWKLEPSDLNRLATLQRELLAEYSRLVKPGGKVVYATCSILPSENQAPVAEFLAAHPDWVLEEELTLWPRRDGGDGFYAARLRAPQRAHPAKVSAQPVSGTTDEE